MTRPSPAFPPELIPFIAQHLASRRRLLTLATLARCSRSTYVAVMPWLYKRVELTEEAAESLFDPLVEVCEGYDCGRDLPQELLELPAPQASPSLAPQPPPLPFSILPSGSNHQPLTSPHSGRRGKQRASPFDTAFDLPLSLRRLQHLRHLRTLIVRDLLYGHTIDQLKLLATTLDDRDLLLLPSLENVVISQTAIERIRRAEKVRKRIPEGLLEAIALAGRVKRVCIHMPEEVPEGMMTPGQRFHRGMGPIGGMGGRWALREHIRDMDGGRRRDGPAPRPRERESSPPPTFGEAVGIAAPSAGQVAFAFGESTSTHTSPSNDSPTAAGPSAPAATRYNGPPTGLPSGAIIVDPRGARDARNTWMAPVTSVYAWLEKLDDTESITVHNVPPSIILPGRPAAHHTFVYRQLPQDGGEVYVDPGATTTLRDTSGDQGVFAQTLQQIQDCIRRGVPPRSGDETEWAAVVARTSWTFHLPPVEWDEVLSDAVRGWARETYPAEITADGEVVGVEKRIVFTVWIAGEDNGWCEACGDDL